MKELIEKKKDGKAMTTAEIEYIVSGYVSGEIPDYQMSAFLMAAAIRGMDFRETYDLTMAMARSGDMLDFSGLDGVVVDKHSTGGVGDKVTLVLSPLVAEAGVHVAKMSGRGLGFTGGTIDKLECIPGFDTSLSEEAFIDNVIRHNIAVSGQTGNLVPADKKIYELRDVTGTVRSIPLIASSIMSKKIASGAEAIVLDVKAGGGAFMRSVDEARELARTMKQIGEMAGRKISGLITSMEEPLGNAVGNSLEVNEAVRAIRGEGPDDLMDIVIALGAQMLVSARRSPSLAAAEERLHSIIATGRAYDKFRQLVSLQGGDPSALDRPLKTADEIIDIKAERSGFVSTVDAAGIGQACVLLGGGRQKKGDPIDPEVGFTLEKKIGDEVKAGDTLARAYVNDKTFSEEAIRAAGEAYTLSENRTSAPKLIIETI